MEHLQRKYLFSDTYGPTSPNPLDRPDPDALITTDFRSQSRETTQREFDIFYDAEQTSHLLRMILELDTETMDALRGKFKDEYVKATTGVFINVAPRDKKGVNGQPFYVATAREGRIRICSTPLEALAPIKHEVDSLEHLPNTGNGLYGDQEQFRSSYTPVLLYPDHGYRMVQDDVADIPDPRTDWHISYVDKFGNVLTHAGEAEKRRIIEQIHATSDGITLLLNGHEYGPYGTPESLAKADPGQMAVYANGNIDVARRWEEGETQTDRLLKSAYHQLGKPAIGSKIQFAEKLAPNSVE